MAAPRRSISDLLAGTKAGAVIASRLARKQQVAVPDEVAQERLSVCIECPLNQEYQKTLAEVKAAEMILKVLGGEPLRDEDGLAECRVCTCSLAAMVRLTDDTHKEIKREGYSFGDHAARKGLIPHKGCWMRKLFTTI